MTTTSVSMQGIGAEHVTMLPGSAVTVGYPCTMEGNNKVKNAGAGEGFCGVAAALRGDLATVQLGGFVRLPYSGESAPAVGWNCLCADGAGGVKKAASGQSYLITSVDTDKKIAEFRL